MTAIIISLLLHPQLFQSFHRCLWLGPCARECNSILSSPTTVLKGYTNAPDNHHWTKSSMSDAQIIWNTEIYLGCLVYVSIKEQKGFDFITENQETSSWHWILQDDDSYALYVERIHHQDMYTHHRKMMHGNLKCKHKIKPGSFTDEFSGFTLGLFTKIVMNC